MAEQPAIAGAEGEMKKDGNWLGRMFGSQSPNSNTIHNPVLACDIKKAGGFQPNQTDFNRPSPVEAAKIKVVKTAGKRGIR